jgi:hypothetical protein
VPPPNESLAKELLSNEVEHDALVTTLTSYEPCVYVRAVVTRSAWPTRCGAVRTS